LEPGPAYGSPVRLKDPIVDDSRMSTQRWRLHATRLTVIAFAMAGLLLATAPSHADAAMSAAEQEVLDLINAERAQHGLEPLVATSTLDAAAAWLAADLSTIDGLNHTDTLGRDLRDRLSAFAYPANSTIRENIAAGYATPEAVVQGWIDSPGHYANILADEAQAAGIALYEAPGTTYRYFWVIDFGSVVDADPPGGSAPVVSVPAAQPAAVSGPVPTRGVGLLVVQENASADQLVATALQGGCTRPAIWITDAGAFVGYLAGAPSFVNQAFPASIPSGTPFIMSCG
jgi:uncharacterized protein YkwD